MKRLTLSDARRLMLSLLIAVTTMSLMAADVPSITMYYPGLRDDNPVELKPTTKAYTYFETGSKIVQNKARIIQNGNVIGTCVYAGTPTGTTTTCMDPAKPENQSLNDLAAGVFTLEIYEVTYLVDGVEYTYSDESAPIGTVSYSRPATNGAVTGKTGIVNTMYSYYSTEGTDGLIVWTFDKAVIPDDIKGELQYGMGEQYTFTPVNPVLSDDGMSLSVDLRGTCYNVDALAPGVTFVDDSGAPTDPPVFISLVIYGLNCVDGTKIATPYTTPEGKVLTILEGQIWETYNYVDLTFDTPVIQSVYFYSSASPRDHYADINADTDMMGILLIGDMSTISSYDVTLTGNSGQVVIDDYTVSTVGMETTIAVKLPASITSTNGLTVGLDNVVYTSFDGSEHAIKPWVFDTKIPEMLTIASIKTLEPGTDCVLHTTAGIKVTFSEEDAGMMFAEDETAGVILVTEDNSTPFAAGTLIRGKLHGAYYGDSMFLIDVEASEYTVSPCDVEAGLEMASVDEALSGRYDARLLTFNASEEMPIYYDKDSEILFIGVDPFIGVVTEFAADLELPANISAVTGVLYNAEYNEIPMLIIRTKDDVKAGEAQPQGVLVSTIAELKALDPFTEASIQLTNAVVTYVDEYSGMAFVEDETGAISIIPETYEPFTTQGKAITALLTGEYYFDGMYIIGENGILSYDETDADVSTGTIMTLDEIADPANAYRLATVINTPETPIVSDDYALYIGDTVLGIDYFDVLGYDMFPAEVESITGIIIPQSSMYMNLDDEDMDDEWGDEWGDEPQMILLAPRSWADIVAKTTSIGSVANDGNAIESIYNINGVKSATNDVKALRKGIYIINGKKVYIK